MKKQRHISRRIMFTAERIKKLKLMVAEDQETGVKNPTRTEILAAFLTKYNLIASSFKPIVLFISVNMRNVINPPLEGNWAGNFISFISISISEEQDLNLAIK
ncbi:hypothetical protein LIER_42159 [Lithospermum erythrorhizon]|uniref:Uncharacterized protein n=1 Tax=Lithospermum erythrorhizon TaxID=34254 RepID=A0AAV3RMB4_LITER